MRNSEKKVIPTSCWARNAKERRKERRFRKVVAVAGVGEEKQPTQK